MPLPYHLDHLVLGVVCTSYNGMAIVIQDHVSPLGTFLVDLDTPFNLLEVGLDSDGVEEASQ